MALSKKIENIVIGLDPKFNQLKILRNNGKNHKNLSIEHLAYEPDFYKGNLFELLDNLISSPHTQLMRLWFCQIILSLHKQ